MVVIPAVPPTPCLIRDTKFSRKFLHLAQVVKCVTTCSCLCWCKRLSRVRFEKLTISILKNTSASKSRTNNASFLQRMRDVSCKSPENNNVWSDEQVFPFVFRPVFIFVLVVNVIQRTCPAFFVFGNKVNEFIRHDRHGVAVTEFTIRPPGYESDGTIHWRISRRVARHKPPESFWCFDRSRQGNSSQLCQHSFRSSKSCRFATASISNEHDIQVGEYSLVSVHKPHPP